MAPLISYFRDARAALGITANRLQMPQERKTWCRTGSVPVVAATERKRLSEITVAVCPGAEEKHQRGELEKPHHQLVDTIRH